MGGGGEGVLSNCPLTGSGGLVRPGAVRPAGGTGSDIKVTEERPGIKCRRGPNACRAVSAISDTRA